MRRLMGVLKALGLARSAWALRRLDCPVPQDAIVLDVGSGGNPYPRANVLLESSPEGEERYGETFVADRPTVIGRAERMPFKDKSFDFVVASHVLEHMSDPGSFLKELMRVGKAGYIECPNAFFERLNPYRYHRLEVLHEGGRLLIRKKKAWVHDPEVVALYEAAVKGPVFSGFISKNPERFHVRYYWRDRIDFEILNPDTDCSWAYPPAEQRFEQRGFVRDVLKSILGRLFEQRGRRLNLSELLMCPACTGVLDLGEGARCRACGEQFPSSAGVPDLTWPRKAN